MESIGLMIQAGADVNEVSLDGVVPLEAAVIFENVETVRMLLRHGANPSLRPRTSVLGDYRSAWEAAQQAPDSAAIREIRQLLAGATYSRSQSSGAR